jgi:hypothetical protein
MALLCSISMAAMAQNNGVPPNPRGIAGSDPDQDRQWGGARCRAFTVNHARRAVSARQWLRELPRHGAGNQWPAETAVMHLRERFALKKGAGAVMHKQEADLLPLTRQERQLADRAYFASRIELLMKLKRLRMKVLVKSDLFYLPSVKTAEERLRFYAERFNTVEVDATYYALPAERNAELWAQRTPPDCLFNIKGLRVDDPASGGGAETAEEPD